MALGPSSETDDDITLLPLTVDEEASIQLEEIDQETLPKARPPPSQISTTLKVAAATSSLPSSPSTRTRAGAVNKLGRRGTISSTLTSNSFSKELSISLNPPEQEADGEPRSHNVVHHVVAIRERELQNAPTCVGIMYNLGYILTWYFFSTALSLYNKNLMGRDNFDLHLPLLLGAIHTGLQFAVTFLMIRVFCRGTYAKPGTGVSLNTWMTKVVPCAVAAALEICMANSSLAYITLSFYTIVKSSTPVWVLLFAFVFGLEQVRASLVAIVSVIVLGVWLTVTGETAFNLTGFMLVLFAAVMSGLRWSLTQILLQQEAGMDNPVSTLYHISPIMFGVMTLLSLIFEDPFGQFTTSDHFKDFSTGMQTFGLMAAGGCLAFCMTIAEFKLIKSTSTVTLSVAGISKEILVISLSVAIYGDHLSPKEIIGLVISIIGIAAFNYYKLKRGDTHGSGGGKGEYYQLPTYRNDVG